MGSVDQPVAGAMDDDGRQPVEDVGQRLHMIGIDQALAGRESFDERGDLELGCLGLDGRIHTPTLTAEGSRDYTAHLHTLVSCAFGDWTKAWAEAPPSPAAGAPEKAVRTGVMGTTKATMAAA